MKRILGIAIAAVLIGASVVPANAAVKAGAVCKKENAGTSVGGVKYLCAKVGTKRIWVKRMETSGYSFGPAGRISYRYVGGKQERLSNYRDWLNKDYRKPNSFDPIRVAAYKEMSTLAVDPLSSNVVVEYTKRPDFPAEIYDAIRYQSEVVTKRLSPLFDKKLVVKIILVTEKDKMYLNDELPSIVPKNECCGDLSIFADYVSLQRFYSRGGTGGGTASYSTEKGYGYYLAHTSSLAKIDTYWPEVVPHELTHVLQGYLAGGFRSEFGEGHPKAKWLGHFIEGSANTLGMGLGFEQLGWYSDELDLLLKNDISYYKKNYPMESVEDAMGLMKEIEKRESQAQNSLSYSAGQIVWEYFIGTYGIVKFISLLKNVASSASFDENLKETIGMSKDDFYRLAAPYLLATWKRLN